MLHVQLSTTRLILILGCPDDSISLSTAHLVSEGVCRCAAAGAGALLRHSVRCSDRPAVEGLVLAVIDRGRESAIFGVAATEGNAFVAENRVLLATEVVAKDGISTVGALGARRGVGEPEPVLSAFDAAGATAGANVTNENVLESRR